MSKSKVLDRTLMQAIRANEKHNFLYLNNPKSGCGSVKLNFWVNIEDVRARQAVRNLHNVRKSPFCNMISNLTWAENANVFTIVRNPFTRVVSSYLDKISVPGKRVRREFDMRYGIKDARDISFDDFVDLICDDEPEQLDHHWRPQHINVLESFVRPNFIGTLESIDRDLPLILNHVLGEDIKPVEVSQRHKTGASTSYFDILSNRSSVGKLSKLYARDFEVYGYTPDISVSTKSSKTAEWTEVKHSELANLAKFRTVDVNAQKRQNPALLEKTLGNSDENLWDGRYRRRFKVA